MLIDVAASSQRARSEDVSMCLYASERKAGVQLLALLCSMRGDGGPGGLGGGRGLGLSRKIRDCCMEAEPHARETRAVGGPRWASCTWL